MLESTAKPAALLSIVDDLIAMATRIRNDLWLFIFPLNILLTFLSDNIYYCHNMAGMSHSIIRVFNRHCFTLFVMATLIQFFQYY